MKRILVFSAILLMSATAALAQCGNINLANLTVTPAVFTAEDVITVTVDLTGTCIASDGVSSMKVWMFSPGCCGALTQGDFCNDTYSGAQFNGRNAVSLGSNRWSYTLRMTEVLDRPAGQISTFGIIFKASDRNPCTGAGGNRQTQDLILTPQPLTYTERFARLFPRLVTDEDVVTLYVNRALSNSSSIQAEDSIYVYAFADVIPAGGGATFFKQVSDWGLVGNRDDLKLKFGGANNQFLRFIPRRLFNLAAGEKLSNVKFVVRNKGGTQQHGGDQIFILQ
jgi:hypothetical protein